MDLETLEMIEEGLVASPVRGIVVARAIQKEIDR